MMFTEQYQAALLARTCDQRFMDKVSHLLDPEMFEDHEHLAEEILRRYAKNQKVLSKTQFQQLCTRFKTRLPKPTGDESFDLDTVAEYAKHQSIKRAFEKAHLEHANGKHETCLDTMMECQRELPRLNGQVIGDMLLSRKPMPKRLNMVETGLGSLDDHLDGGVGAGDLAVVLAPTSGGKTSLLSWFATYAVTLGKKVYYTTLEVPFYEIEMKVRRCITGDRNPTKSKWAKASSAVSKNGGKLWVREHPPNSISAAALDAEIPKDADLIIVDYADYLSPPSGTGNHGMEYHDLGHIYTHLKRIGMSRRVPIWTASQVNRAAYGSPELRAEDVEASLKKMMICDQAVSISQVEKPDEKTGRCLCQMHIAKNRHGARYINIDVTADFGLCTFSGGHRV